MENTSKPNNKLILRIVLSPFIFICGYIILLPVTIFPILPMLVIFSAFGIISTPIIWLLIKSGVEIEYIQPLIPLPCKTIAEYEFHYNNNTWMHVRNHFLGMSIYLWIVFVLTYQYIKTGTNFLIK